MFMQRLMFFYIKENIKVYLLQFWLFPHQLVHDVAILDRLIVTSLFFQSPLFEVLRNGTGFVMTLSGEKVLTVAAVLKWR